MNSIKWSTKSVKQILKINKPEQLGIKNAIGELAQMPDKRNVVALTNHRRQFRLRVGELPGIFELWRCNSPRLDRRSEKTR